VHTTRSQQCILSLWKCKSFIKAKRIESQIIYKSLVARYPKALNRSYETKSYCILTQQYSDYLIKFVVEMKWRSFIRVLKKLCCILQIELNWNIRKQICIWTGFYKYKFTINWQWTLIEIFIILQLKFNWCIHFNRKTRTTQDKLFCFRKQCRYLIKSA